MCEIVVGFFNFNKTALLGYTLWALQFIEFKGIIQYFYYIPSVVQPSPKINFRTL